MSAPDGDGDECFGGGRGAVHGLVAQLLAHEALQHAQQELLEVALVADKALELALQRLLHAQLLRADEALQQHPAPQHTRSASMSSHLLHPHSFKRNTATILMLGFQIAQLSAQHLRGPGKSTWAGG